MHNSPAQGTVMQGGTKGLLQASSTISKSCVMSTPAFCSMMEAEQYFSADSCTARSTLSASRALPLTTKCRLIVSNTAGTPSALTASRRASQPLTCCRPLRRMFTTSNDEQPPTPSNSISMGLIPMFLPPASSGPSMTTACPEPDSPINMAPSIHFTVAFIVTYPTKWMPLSHNRGRHWCRNPMHLAASVDRREIEPCNDL